MDVFYKRMDSKELEKLQIRAPIMNYHAKFVTIEVKRKVRDCKRIDNEMRYHVEFCPNFFSNAMAQRALRRITKYNYEAFFVNFNSKSLPIQSKMRFDRFVITEWFNKDVGANGPQTRAIKNIVDRNNFPSPYLIFGPPGKEDFTN